MRIQLSSQNANVIGALWMVLAMAGFAMEDAFLKAASGSLPISQILVLFGLGGACVFAVSIRLKGAALYQPEVISRPMKVRAVFEILGRLFYVLALALSPLSSTTVILQATPIVVVAGAAMFFGERVGWRRWTAIFVGLIGVTVIVQPGSDSFSYLSVLAVLGMLGFAGRDLASRAAPKSLSISILGLYGFLSLFLSGVIFAFWERLPFVVPNLPASFMLLGATLCGTIAYASLMTAMRTGDVSAVTPFRYSRMIFGLALGILLFGEGLSLMMIIGSGLVILSGLFLIQRGRAVQK